MSVMDRLKAIRGRVGVPETENGATSQRNAAFPAEDDPAAGAAGSPPGPSTANMWDLAVDPAPADDPHADDIAAPDPAPKLVAFPAPAAPDPAPRQVDRAPAGEASWPPKPRAAAPAWPPAPAPAAPVGRAAEPEPRRGGRVKTRLLGFDHSNGETTDFEEPGRAAPARSAGPAFPVGWLVVTSGPGRGSSFALSSGVSQIGRGEDQAVRLDFGDATISRSGHAAIAFDEESRAFFIGHGGKSNLVRLNGKPLLSTETVSHGDQIQIGETGLRLVALCGESFCWSQAADGSSAVNG